MINNYFGRGIIYRWVILTQCDYRKFYVSRSEEIFHQTEQGFAITEKDPADNNGIFNTILSHLAASNGWSAACLPLKPRPCNPKSTSKLVCAQNQSTGWTGQTSQRITPRQFPLLVYAIPCESLLCIPARITRCRHCENPGILANPTSDFENFRSFVPSSRLRLSSLCLSSLDLLHPLITRDNFSGTASVPQTPRRNPRTCPRLKKWRKNTFS